MAKYTHSHASLDLKAHAMSIMKGSGCQVCFLRVKLHFRKAIWAWLELTSEPTDRQLTRILCKSFLVSAHTTTHFLQKWILLLLQVALSWLIPLKSSYDPILNYSPAVKPQSRSTNPVPMCPDHPRHYSQSRQTPKESNRSSSPHRTPSWPQQAPAWKTPRGSHSTDYLLGCCPL